jgi:hypothetical protein
LAALGAGLALDTKALNSSLIGAHSLEGLPFAFKHFLYVAIFATGTELRKSVFCLEDIFN